AAAVPWSDYRPVAEPVAAALETLARPVEAIRGVGPQRAAQLSRFGLRTVEDALYHLPFRYEDRRALRPLASLHVGEEATAAGEVAHVRESRGGRRRRAVLEVVRRDVQAAVTDFAERVPSALPPAVAARQRVIELPRALRHVHAPRPEAALEELAAARSLAHRSLIFDELFFLQLGLALRRQAAGEEPGTAFPPSTALAPAFRAQLPFALTTAQERAFVEIATDLGAPHPM